MDMSLMDNYLYLSTFLCALLSLADAGRSLQCEFPESWRGHWHQASLGQIYVTNNVISKKGTCIESYSDYYIIQNTDNYCVACLLMLRRHDNIIQYKESYCIRTANHHSVCSSIQVEANMYTLVKDPTNSIPCPFPDNYRVTYDEGYHGYLGSCDTANSYLSACGGGEKSMSFHFEHCNTDAPWNGQDLRFECLATWKEGSEDFLYGRFSGNVIARKDESYRCFKYDARGTQIQVAMSADATCRGLNSPESGPVVMLLEKDISNEPDPGCTYPSWLTSSRWQDYTGDVIVAFHGHRHKLSLQTSTLHDRLICKEILPLDVDEYVVSAYFAQNCGSSYQCLRFKRLNDRAFVLRRSDVITHEIDAFHCSARQPQDSDESMVFISSRVIDEPLGCPNPGVYSYLDNNCDMHVYAGCNSVTSILVKPQCPSMADIELQCITYWSEGSSTYWVVRNTQDIRLHCNVLTETSPQNFTMNTCSHPQRRSQFHNVLVQKHGTCSDVIPTRRITANTSPVIISSTESMSHNRHPPDKHVPTYDPITRHDQVAYNVPSTHLKNTHEPVTSSSGKDTNSDDDSLTSQQYSSHGASHLCCSQTRTLVMLLIFLLSFAQFMKYAARL